MLVIPRSPRGTTAYEVLVRTMPAFLGYGAGLAVLLGTFDYTGGVLTGYSKDPEVDEYERKEMLRRNRRRPIQETVTELGEGRGMTFPVPPQAFTILVTDSFRRYIWPRLR